MEFITRTTGKKRQMIVLPQANPNSFVFFFEKGNMGYSWSVRDYSAPYGMTERYAQEFGCSASAVREKALFSFDAPTVPTTELSFWREYTELGNKLFLQKNLARSPVPELSRAQKSALVLEQPHFPLLNVEALRKLPKAAKRQDLDRMLSSPNSEDWVTWNFFNLLVSENPNDWHLKVLLAARNANADLQCSMDSTDTPHLEFWRKVPSPPGYEQASRARMRQSLSPALIARSSDPRPVEGDSEIDVVVSTDRHLVFVEAKLGSDISSHTTYDAARNQIVRNIDCVLESAGEREALFWMLVRDLGPGRLYTQLVKQYQEHPDLLIGLLPHRDPRIVSKICRSIAIIRWEELRGHVLEGARADSDDVRAVKGELRKRLLIAV